MHWKTLRYFEPKTGAGLIRKHPHLSVSSIIAAFHTPSPIHYVTFDRKWDATAQGVKRRLLKGFYFILSVSFSCHSVFIWMLVLFLFIVQKRRIDLGTNTDKTLKPICCIFPCNVMQYKALSGQLVQLCVGVCCLSVVFKRYCSSVSVFSQSMFCTLDISI